MQIPFYKMHGAANDFIVVDDRGLSFPVGNPEWMRSVMARNTGVGSEGILLIQPDDEADFRMRFFNPDGGEVDMCGNGARCIARLACELGVAPPEMQFATQAGRVGAQVDGEIVQLTMTPPTDWCLEGSLEIEGQALAYTSVNSGVPHVVIEVEDVAAIPVQTWGAAVRYHADFAPQGTNANFVQVLDAHMLKLRTYERGVEAETPACGTGIVAAALLSAKRGRVAAPVQVVTVGGYQLAVDFHLTDEGAADVTLTGPAAHVFQGSLTYPGAD